MCWPLISGYATGLLVPAVVALVSDQVVLAPVLCHGGVLLGVLMNCGVGDAAEFFVLPESFQIHIFAGQFLITPDSSQMRGETEFAPQAPARAILDRAVSAVRELR